jgi:hypothetical protein
MKTINTHVVLETPSVAVDLPDRWEIDETIDCWLVLRPSEQHETDGFLPNVAIVMVRVPRDLSLDALREQTIAELRRDYPEVEIHAETVGEDMFDRSVHFTAQKTELVQYQRCFVVPSITDRVNWFVQIQATAPTARESAFADTFGAILSSIQIAVPEPFEPRPSS